MILYSQWHFKGRKKKNTEEVDYGICRKRTDPGENTSLSAQPEQQWDAILEGFLRVSSPRLPETTLMANQE